MNQKLEKASFVGIIVGGIATVIFILYGCYWVTKTISYSIFYEDMVKQTVVEMVKPESLKI